MHMNPRYLLAAPALALVLTMIPACGDDSGNNSPGSTLPAITDSTPVEPSSDGSTSLPAETTAPLDRSASTTGSGRGLTGSVAAVDASDIDLVSTAAFADGHPW